MWPSHVVVRCCANPAPNEEVANLRIPRTRVTLKRPRASRALAVGICPLATRKMPATTGTLAIKDDKHDRPQSNTAGSSMVRRLSGWGYLHSRTDLGAGFRRGRMARVPRDMDCDWQAPRHPSWRRSTGFHSGLRWIVDAHRTLTTGAGIPRGSYRV